MRGSVQRQKQLQNLAVCDRAEAGTETQPEKKADGVCHYYVSDSTEGFSEMASLFLQQPVGDRVSQIDIERY